MGGALLLCSTAAIRWRTERFSGEPAALESIVSIVARRWRVRQSRDRAARLLLLIATPVARVAFTLVAFALQGDRKYVVITSSSCHCCSTA